MKKKLIYLFSLFTVFALGARVTFAVCPICTLAVGAGVGLSRWLGIDDTVSGVWVGGLVVSLILWTENWLDKKNIRFRLRFLLNALFYYLIVVLPLYFTGIIGHPNNKLLCFCGLNIDKLLFGIIAGSIGFFFGASFYNYLKEKNDNRAYFPFQKVVMPIGVLVILSVLFYYLTK